MLAQKQSILISGGGGLWNSGRLSYLRSESWEASSSGLITPCLLLEIFPTTNITWHANIINIGRAYGASFYSYSSL